MQEKFEVSKLETAISENTNLLRQLAAPYKSFFSNDPRSNGFLGQPRDFRKECKELDYLVSLVQEINVNDKKNYSLRRISDIYCSIESSMSSTSYSTYGGEFESSIRHASRDNSEQKQIKLEKATIHYLRYLELKNECLKKWVQVLARDKDDEDVFRGFFKQTQRYTLKLQKEIVTFKENLSRFAVRHNDPLRKKLDNPKSINEIQNTLATLNENYCSAYEKINPFWRWIKYLFQRSERAQEIQFLQELSTRPSCTNFIRVEAIKLVHNKIVASETFSAGSKLKNMLADVGEQTYENDEEQSLSSFLDANNDLIDRMPQGLKDYYNAMKEDLGTNCHA